MPHEPVKSTDPDWNAWARLANDVGAANRRLDSPLTFSARSHLARALWDMGYRAPVRGGESR